MAIKPMQLADGSTIYIEVENTTEAVELISHSNQSKPDLPPGAEPTGIVDDIVIGGKLLQETISNTVENVHQSLQKAKPDEWSVELNVGFESTEKGIISYLGKGNGSLKVTATWKKPREDTSA